MNIPPPGFYYDKAKNRFFKIRPGEVAPTTHLNDDENKPQKSIFKPLRTYPNLLSTLSANQIGSINSGSLYKRYSLTCLQFKNAATESVPRISTNNEDNSRIIFNKSQKFAIFSNQRIHHSFLLSDNFLDNRLKSCAYFYVDLLNTISFMSWNKRDIDADFYAIGFTRNYKNYCRLYKAGFPEPVVEWPIKTPNSIFCASWISSGSFLTIGASKACILLDIQTGRIVNKFPIKNDILQQETDNQRILFNGLRGGKIELVDIRSNKNSNLVLGSSRSKPKFCNQSFYGSVNPKELKLLGENYLLANYSDGTMLLWDIRLDDCLVKYSGDVSSFCMDENNNFLFCIGKDKILRTYDWTNGQLSHATAPLPLYNIPQSMGYIEKWYDVPSNVDLSRDLEDVLHYSPSHTRPALCFSNAEFEKCYFHSLYQPT